MGMVYEETCEVMCTDKDQMVIAEILDYKPNNKLSVSIERTIRVDLQYNPRHKIYIGSTAGLEFTSDGPIGRNIKQHRR